MKETFSDIKFYLEDSRAIILEKKVKNLQAKLKQLELKRIYGLEVAYCDKMIIWLVRASKKHSYELAIKEIKDKFKVLKSISNPSKISKGGHYAQLEMKNKLKKRKK